MRRAYLDFKGMPFFALRPTDSDSRAKGQKGHFLAIPILPQREKKKDFFFFFIFLKNTLENLPFYPFCPFFRYLWNEGQKKGKKMMPFCPSDNDFIESTFLAPDLAHILYGNRASHWFVYYQEGHLFPLRPKHYRILLTS